MEAHPDLAWIKGMEVRIAFLASYFPGAVLSQARRSFTPAQSLPAGLNSCLSSVLRAGQ